MDTEEPRVPPKDTNFETVGHHHETRYEIIRTIHRTQFNGMVRMPELAAAALDAGIYNTAQQRALLQRAVMAECRKALKVERDGLPYAICSASDGVWRQIDLISFDQAQEYVDDQLRRTEADIAKTNRFIRHVESRFDQSLALPSWWHRDLDS